MHDNLSLRLKEEDWKKVTITECLTSSFMLCKSA